MPTIKEEKIRGVRLNGSEVSSLRFGHNVAWERPTVVSAHYISASGIQVPDWTVAIAFAIIGGGGGGQTGNGSNNRSGRPGGAAQWAIYYRNLERNVGEKFHINLTIGAGGSGGSNSDHAAGSNGAETTATLWKQVGGVQSNVALYKAEGGLAGPASGLGVGHSSQRPTVIAAPREYPTRAFGAQLPSGVAAEKEKPGGTPGAGGGYGGGGYFGSRGRGGKGGDGLAMFYFYGAH